MTEAATSDELAFVDRLLDSWATWAHSDSHGRYAKPSAAYSTGPEALPCVLPLSDQQFEQVDHAVARLPVHLKNLIAVNYFRALTETRKRKAMLLGMSVGRYTRYLQQAQAEVLAQLPGDVYTWQGL